MRKVNLNNQSGFFKLIIVIVVALIILGYFGFNVENLVKSPTASSNLHYLWGLVGEVWNRFIVGPLYFIWNNIVIGLVWNNLMRLISISQ